MASTSDFDIFSKSNPSSVRPVPKRFFLIDLCRTSRFVTKKVLTGSRGVMASTSDFESDDPSSNLGGICLRRFSVSLL